MVIGRFHVYGAESTEWQALEKILAKTELLIEAHQGALPDNVTIVFPSRLAFRILNVTSMNAYASTNGAHNIWINDRDIANDRIVSNLPPFHSRTLSSILAHEIMHVTISQQFGYLTHWTAPTWIQEGYCDFIARETSMPFTEGIVMIQNHVKDNSKSYTYFKSYIATRGLIEVEKRTLADLLTARDLRDANPDAIAEHVAPLIASQL